MFRNVKNWLWNKITVWLNATSKSNQNVAIINNFEDMQSDLKIADVILFEGRSRVSEVIKIITLSPWTHAAIYIGRLDQIKNPITKNLVATHYNGDPKEPLVIDYDEDVNKSVIFELRSNYLTYA